MGQITSSIGLISGINTEDIIKQLIELESRPKLRVEARNKELEEQQTAFSEISASLLGLKLNANKLTTNSLFKATTATSSNEDVATVTSGPGAAPGNYRFSVKRLVSSQQTITKGFASSDVSFIAPQGGLIAINRGDARLDRDTDLRELNGGKGVTRGSFRITDRSGASELIDLTEAVTLNDVMNAINRSQSVSVKASIDGDKLVLADATGLASGTLRVTDVGDTSTGTDLGLVGSTTGAAITGTDINTVGTGTVLTSLNDGNGVRNSSGADFQITARDGTVVNVDLGNSVTLGQVFEVIDTASAGKITAAATADGKGIRLIDNTTGGSTFSVAAVGDSNTLQDLGLVGVTSGGGGTITGARINSELNTKSLKNLFGGKGLNAFGGAAYTPVTNDTLLDDLLGGAGLTTSGDGLEDLRIFGKNSTTTAYAVNLDGLTTVGELINTVNTATGGAVQLQLRNDKLFAVDTTNGQGKLVIESINGSKVAGDLGIGGSFDGQGNDVVAGVKLNPTGTGNTGATIRITNSAGTVTNINLAASTSIADMLKRINNAGAGLAASLNSAGTGIQITDTAGGIQPLVIEEQSGGLLATQLGIAGTFNKGVAEGRDLEFAYITQGTTLEKLGIARGSFTLRDSAGRQAAIDLSQGDEVTLDDVLREINSRGLALTARINDEGNGLLLEDTGPGASGIEVLDDGSTTARDLGIAGTFGPGQDVNGTFQRYLRVSAVETLSSLAKKITDAEVGLAANVISDGSPGEPFRLSLSAQTAGTTGAFTISDFGMGLGVSNVATARDAVVFYGGEDPTEAQLITSKTNTLAGLIPGATITLKNTSEGPITVSVSNDPDEVVENVQSFVDGFNELVERFDELDAYDAETQERGLLLGDATLQQVRSSLYNALIGANAGLSGKYKSLSQVGLKVVQGAKLEFDADKFRQALEEDRDAVEQLFGFKQFVPDPETGEDTDEIAVQGIGVEIDRLLARLTDADTGVVQRRIDTLDRQILQNQDRIESLDETLERKRESLQRQFNNMEAALARLQDQGGALGQLAALSQQARG